MFKGLSIYLKRHKLKYVNSVYQSERPVTRSRLRLFLGGLYFTWRRYLQWFFVSSKQYATSFQTSQLPFKVADHGTPLYRRLRNVDIWLQENKVTNLKLATAKINGLVLKPGEILSIWRLVGKPTKAKGFKEGMVLNNGSFRTQHCYQLLLRVGDSDLEGEWRCEQPLSQKYKVYESDHLIKQEWWGGYVRHNVIRRKVFDLNNNQIGDDYITENHAIMMYEPMLAGRTEVV